MRPRLTRSQKGRPATARAVLHLLVLGAAREENSLPAGLRSWGVDRRGRYAAEPRRPTRFRRKCVRRSGGIACHRRISSSRARSFSAFRALSAARRRGGFGMGLLQDLQDGLVSGPTGGPLALDDIPGLRRTPRGRGESAPRPQLRESRRAARENRPSGCASPRTVCGTRAPHAPPAAGCGPAATRGAHHAPASALGHGDRRAQSTGARGGVDPPSDHPTYSLAGAPCRRRRSRSR